MTDDVQDSVSSPPQSRGRSRIAAAMARLKLSKGADSRKTVAFGDAAAVRSLPGWSFISLVALIAFWWLSTMAFGIPSEFVEANPGLSDQNLVAACELDDQCKESLFQLVSPRAFPSPSDTWSAAGFLATDGISNKTLWDHTSASLWRVARGMTYGSIIGIPIGFAMALSSRARGFFDTPVEMFRPIPPLALLPLFILSFGIGDGSAVKLLVFASVWIMIIAARAGVRTANLSKVRAAYSLGASRTKVLFEVLLPNALPELFTGFRVALGVSWGTLVAAELVGTKDGLGTMIFRARPLFRLDVMVVGVIIISVLGVAMDMILRYLESKLIPWRGKG